MHPTDKHPVIDSPHTDLHENPYEDFLDPERPVSFTDMTGLIPAAVDNDAQADAYEHLYPNHRQKPIDEKGKY